jgi:predicted nucleotidyltransferase
VQTAQPVDLGDGLTIRLVTAVAFVATKLEAWAGRGRGDLLSSHDLEDVLNIVDGREELVAEMAAAPPDVRNAVGAAIGALCAHADFDNVLPGLLADPSRADLVMARLHSLRS